MAWNGSGVFSRLYNWVNDRDADINITASRMDAEHDDMAAGIQACVAKNGENAATANLPMGGYKHTGAAAGASSGEYATYEQVVKGSANYIADSGAADTLTIAPSPALTAYASGVSYLVKANATNTGAATLNVSSLGAKAIKKRHDQALAAGDIEAGGLYLLSYDGTNFQLVSSISNPAGAVVGTTDTQTLSAKTLTAPAISAAQFTSEAYYDAEVDNGTQASAFTIDWTAGNRQKVTVEGSAGTMSFTDPSGACDLQLLVVQGSGGGHIKGTWPAILTPGGGASAWSLSASAGDIDVLNLYFDGTTYYGQLSTGWA